MRRQKWIAGIAIGLVLASSLACSFSIPISDGDAIRGSGNVIEETREVSGFTAIQVDSFGDIFVELGDEEALRIEAEDNLLPYIETDVRGGTLVIDTQSGVNLRPFEPVRFYLTVEDLDRIEINGSGDVQVPDLETDRFSITIKGSGDIEIESLTVDTFEVEIDGSGDIQVDELHADTIEYRCDGSGSLDVDDGMVDDQQITIAGSGNYYAPGLESTKAEVWIGGSGSVTLRVSDELDVTVSGSGSVRYIGNPQVEQSTPGSGSIIQVDE